MSTEKKEHNNHHDHKKHDHKSHENKASGCCSAKKAHSDDVKTETKGCCSATKDTESTEKKSCCSTKNKTQGLEGNLDKKETVSSNTFMTVISILVIIVVFINVIFLFNFTQKLDNKLTNIIDENKGQVGTLVVLQDNNCIECKDINEVKDQIAKANLELTSDDIIDFNTAEGKALAQKYSITKLPAIIFESQETLKASLVKSWEKSGKQTKNSFVWETQKIPYFDINTGNTTGIVQATIVIKSDCEECSAPQKYIDSFRAANIFINQPKIIESNSPEGKELIQKYSATKLPLLVFSKEISLYDTIKKSWSQFGKVTESNDYIITKPSAPYFDITQNKTVGLVDIMYLVDNSSTEYYDINIHKNIFKQMGVKFSNENTVDISSAEGKRLIKKYSIKKVPTVILSEDAKYYPPITGAWSQVGTIETDGSFVFRKLEVLGQNIKYKEL